MKGIIIKGEGNEPLDTLTAGVDRDCSTPPTLSVDLSISGYCGNDGFISLSIPRAKLLRNWLIESIKEAENEVIPASEVVDPFEGRETRRRLGCLCGSTDEDITHEVIYIFNDDAYFEMCRRCRTKKPPCTSIVATRPKGKTGAGVVTLWGKTIVADKVEGV